MSKATKDFSAVNWRELRDVDVAFEYGISRERARQLRNKIGRPCVNKRKSSNQITIENYVAVRKLPATAAELYSQLPIKIGKHTAYAMFRKIGLDLDFRPPRGATPRIFPVDWRLPNTVIDSIWSRGRYNWAANTRSRLGKPESAWHIGGGRGFTLTTGGLKQLLACALEQAATAAKVGVKFNAPAVDEVLSNIKKKVLTSK
jgi:hypothetical protein